MKKCSKCKQEKERSEFWKHKLKKDGLNYWCIECSKEYNKKYHVKTYDLRREKDKLGAVGRKLKNRYGITQKEYKELLDFQNDVCAICGKPESTIYKGKIKRLSVDHNHNLPKSHPKYIRGLLCDNCNHSLGLLGDNIDILKKMIDYLEMTL